MERAFRKTVVLTAMTVIFVCSLSTSLPLPDAANSYEEVHPVETDRHGTPLDGQAWLLSQAPPTQGPNRRRYFSLNLQGISLLLNVTKSDDEGSTSRQEVPVYRVTQNGTATRAHVIAGSGNDCRYTGTVHRIGQEQPMGWTAISTCKGVHGLLNLESVTFTIEPHKDAVVSQEARGSVQTHRVQRLTTFADVSATDCVTTGLKRDQVRSVRNQYDQKRHSHLTTEKVIETALVVDKETLDYHGNYTDLVAYMLDIMSVVSHIFQDASTGSAVKVVLVKLIIVESDESPFQESSVATSLKSSFCEWQSRDPVLSAVEHDIAVLVTRKNICEANSCSILGIANLGSMCDPARSCVVVKDTGLSVAYTISHEIGHSLGLGHDGDAHSDCQMGYYLMAPSFSESSNPHQWSPCSKKGLQDFFLSHDSSCLDNHPQTTIAPPPSSVPIIGENYTLDEQCSLLYGPDAVFCTAKVDEVCNVLHCQLGENTSCVSKHSPPAPGSPCTLENGKDGLCYQGQCEHYSVLSQPVDGGWGEWGPWSNCNQDCDGGIQYRARECNAPEPAYGGLHCVGAKRQYHLCNVQECQSAILDYREEMCSKFAGTLGHGSESFSPPSHALMAYYHLEPCQVYCVSNANHFLIYTLQSPIPDGTSCITDHTAVEGMCILNECIQIGCDGQLGTKIYDDACGVTCGNGSTCQNTSGTTITRGKPSYSWRTSNWSACSSPCGYGQASREVGCTSQDDQLVEESHCDPTKKPETSQSCVVESCDNFQWVASDWSQCDTHCGQGTQTRSVNCQRLNGSRVEEKYCGNQTKPVLSRGCENNECPTWQMTLWTECTASCNGGTQERRAECLSSDGHVSLNCDANLRPADETRLCNTHPCCIDYYPQSTCEAIKAYCSLFEFYRINCCKTCTS